jgi:hypothetical protein
VSDSKVATEIGSMQAIQERSTMKLSIETTTLLKNFSKIQTGILVQPGNTLKVRSEQTFAEANVAETFPIEVRISNLPGFLRTLALFKDPDIDISGDHIRITEADGTAELVYPQAKPESLILMPIPKRIKPDPPEQITFTISGEEWATLQKAFGIGGVRKNNDWGGKIL